MGTTNLRFGIENKLAHMKGELENLRIEIGTIEEGVARLSQCYQRAKELEEAIQAGETFFKFHNPDWQPAKIKAVQARIWNGPIKNGEQGRTALGILRENGGWMSCRELAEEMLRQVGHPDDRILSEKTANTLGAYMRKYEGDLVEGKDQYPKKWRVIRERVETPQS
jgi:hypothetical protein